MSRATAGFVLSTDAEDHGRRTARLVLGLDGDGFTAAPAQVIVRESA